MNTPRLALIPRWLAGPRRRRGTVLIFVIALLVLMALIGTAYISTTRQDTYSSRTNAVNAQVDLLVEGGKNIAVGKIVDSVFGDLATPAGKKYRPASQTGALYTYLNYTSPVDTVFLASRVPETGPVWPNITDPLIGTQFEDPTTGTAWTPAARTPAPNYGIGANGLYPSINNNVAGDADGDGIADCGLIKIPMKDLDGLTWYYGFRIIDNNSAVNASVAWQHNSDYTGYPGSLAGDFFPTNVGLTSLLSTTNGADGKTDIARLNEYRFNGASAGSAIVDDNNQGHGDAQFISPYDAMWMQLGRRLGNPGYNVAGTKYQALSLSDAISLAAHFCILTSDNQSTIHQLLISSDTGVRSTPYAANDYAVWFNAFFNYAPGVPSNMPARPLLTTNNPVTNFAPVKFVDKGDYNPTTAYTFGQWVQYKGLSYVALAPTTGQQPDATPAVWQVMPWISSPMRASVNTAPFGELWLAYWSAMVDQVSAGGGWTAPTGTDTTLYRSSIRDASGTAKLSADQQLQLRAALAAVNTLDLRDNDVDLTSGTITIGGYSVTIFGSEPQPYLTEIYVNSDNVTPAPTSGLFNAGGYVSIELYNPYPFAIDLKGCRLATVARPAAGGAMTLAPFIDFSNALITSNYQSASALGPTIIPPNGYLVLENYNAAATAPAAPPSTDANYRPASSGLPEVGMIPEATRPKGNFAYVPGLAGDTTTDPLNPTTGVYNNEVILMRPVKSQWNARINYGTSQVDVLQYVGPTVGVVPPAEEMAPLDQYDFTGLMQPVPSPAPAGSLLFVAHYARQNGVASPWKFVYPGVYDATVAAGLPRYTGSEWKSWDPTVVTTEPALALAAPQLGGEDAAGTYTNNFPGVQIANVDFAGPTNNPATYNAPQTTLAPIPNHLPFGEFARNGDILKVPFIGAYTVKTSGAAANSFIELNGVSIDSAFADDKDTGGADDAFENIGRFTPLAAASPGFVGTDAYASLSALFDYLTVQAPNDSYLPNRNPLGYTDNTLYPTNVIPQAVAGASDANTLPSTYGRATIGSASSISASNSLLPTTGIYKGATVLILSGAAQGQSTYVSDYTYAAGVGTLTLNPALSAAVGAGDLFRIIGGQDSASIQGLININTAPWKVLATLPMVLNTSGGIDQANNDALAKQIVTYRNTNGAFKTIYDLNKVSSFQTAGGTFTPATDDPDDTAGDISPAGAGTDGVKGDFESSFLVLNRISNLITTRSDSFTVYVLVEGWQDAGTAQANRIVQRRAAYLVDRTSVTPLSKDPKTVYVPNN